MKDFIGVMNISNEDYHASAGISRSAIMEFKKTPKHYQYKYFTDIKKEPTKALRVGAGLHQLLTNEGLQFVCRPDIKRNTTAGKEEWADFLAKNEGKTIVAPEEYYAMKNMADTVKNHKYAKNFFELSLAFEKSLYWTDEESTLLCKARPDIICDSNTIIEIKTTEDASKWAFRGSIKKYGYHIQAAMQADGLEMCTGTKCDAFVFLVVEKSAPHAIGLYELDALSIQKGRDEYKQILKDMRDCQVSGEWPDYATDIITVSLIGTGD